MILVTDASAWLGMVSADEDAAYALAVAAACVATGPKVPAIFWFEVRHVLIRGERQGRVTRAGSEALLRALGAARPDAEPQPPEEPTLRLARHHNLSVYDASYLELAARLDATLATLDRKLARAAAAEGVRLFEPAHR